MELLVIHGELNSYHGVHADGFLKIYRLIFVDVHDLYFMNICFGELLRYSVILINGWSANLIDYMYAKSVYN